MERALIFRVNGLLLRGKREEENGMGLVVLAIFRKFGLICICNRGV